MEKTVPIFSSFEEADRADALADARLTPPERLRIVEELRAEAHPDAAEHLLGSQRQTESMEALVLARRLLGVIDDQDIK